jgi:predicted transcriptional regulator YdeE
VIRARPANRDSGVRPVRIARAVKRVTRAVRSVGSMTQPILVDVPARRVTGLAVRTSFATVAGEAGPLWQRALASGLAARGPLFGVYAEYDADVRGAYTMLIGTEATAPAIDGERGVDLPAGRYARFAADGAPEVAVAAAWRYIHGDWPDRDRRTYVADFEIHGARGPATTDVYVGVR